MIAKLTGIVDSLLDGAAIIDVRGVGYLVSCSGRTLSRLVPGESVAIWVETQVRDDAIHLYGFADAAEREWFRRLTTVQAVGAKAALAVLSILAPDELTLAIAAGDKAAITRAAGVGPRLAARIVSELKDKAGILASTTGAVSSAGTGSVGGVARGRSADAVAALVQLGFRPSEALAAVSDVSGRLGADARLEALIRAALAALAPGDAQGDVQGDVRGDARGDGERDRERGGETGERAV